MTEDRDKAWLVTYPGLEFDEESEVTFGGETRNKVKYWFLGAGDDAEWVDIRVVRAKDLDGMKDKWNTNSRFRNLWFLNNGFMISEWDTGNKKDYQFNAYLLGDEIREALQYPYEQKLAYADVDMYVGILEKEK